MFQKHRVRLFVLSLFALSIIVTTGAGAASNVQAQNNPLKIVASFSIVADVAQVVAGDAAVVNSLIPIGQDPHAFQPTPKNVVRLSEADAVFVVGINFEENLLPVLEEAAANRMVVVSECVPVRLFGDAHDDEHDHEGEDVDHDHHDMLSEPCATHHALVDAALADSDDHDEDDHHAHTGIVGLVTDGVCGEDNHGTGDHTHAAGSCDPHVWLDPVNVALWTLTIRDTLSALDPAHADVYTANADAYLQALAALDREIHDLLAAVPAQNRYIVTNHQSFNYFAARYGFEIVGTVIPGSPGTEPSAQDIVRLIETIQEFGVPAIFTETTVSENLADQIADETGAQIVRLYTGSLSRPDEPAATYLDYMRFNATQIATALQ